MPSGMAVGSAVVVPIGTGQRCPVDVVHDRPEAQSEHTTGNEYDRAWLLTVLPR